MSSSTIRSEPAATYHVAAVLLTESEKETLAAASEILLKLVKAEQVSLTSPELVKRYLQTKLAAYEYESFMCLFLDNRNRVISAEELFRGTIDGASVYAREVVKRALQVNAAAIVFAHNHPSGVAEPSGADQRLNQQLIKALELVDIRVLDHIVVGSDSVTSFAERGLL